MKISNKNFDTNMTYLDSMLIDVFNDNVFRFTTGPTNFLGSNYLQNIQVVFDSHCLESGNVASLYDVKDFKNIVLRLKTDDFPLMTNRLKLENIEKLRDIRLSTFLDLAVEFAKATEKGGDWLTYMIEYIIKKSK
jgi:hypothetical protein